MKSKLMITALLLSAIFGALILNGCGSSSSSGAKFTIIGSGN